MPIAAEAEDQGGALSGWRAAKRKVSVSRAVSRTQDAPQLGMLNAQYRLYAVGQNEPPYVDGSGGGPSCRAIGRDEGSCGVTDGA